MCVMVFCLYIGIAFQTHTHQLKYKHFNLPCIKRDRLTSFFYCHTATATFLNGKPKSTKHSKGRKKLGAKPEPITLDITETAMYETLDTDDPYPKPSLTTKDVSDSSAYTYIPAKRDGGGVTGKGESLYHVVGPNAIGNGKRAPIAPPPVPSRNGNGHAPSATSGSDSSFYHMLEGAMGNASVHYEDPTLPQFRVCVLIVDN